MIYDIWFYAFIISTALLGYVWGRLRSRISELEREKEEKAVRGFRGAFGEGKYQ